MIMKDAELEEDINSTKVVVHDGTFAYLKLEELPCDECFMITKDTDEVTAVVREENLSDFQYEDVSKGFKLIEFKITKPFLCVGFLAVVSSTVAARGINILLVSTFSKDYALIREEHFDEAVDALEEKGFTFSV